MIQHYNGKTWRGQLSAVDWLFLWKHTWNFLIFHKCLEFSIYIFVIISRHSKLCLLNFERMIVNANSFSILIFDFSSRNFFWNFCFVCFSFHFANHSTYLRSKCIRTLRVNLTNTYGIIIQFQSSKCIWIEFSFRNIIRITKDKNYKKSLKLMNDFVWTIFDLS